jgi:hypothetical protein
MDHYELVHGGAQPFNPAYRAPRHEECSTPRVDPQARLFEDQIARCENGIDTESEREEEGARHQYPNTYARPAQH